MMVMTALPGWETGQRELVRIGALRDLVQGGADDAVGVDAVVAV